MFCHFMPFAGKPGRFICERCKTTTAWNKQYGPEGPPPRHCPVSEDPYDDDTARWIIKILCPHGGNRAKSQPCERHNAGKCETTSACERGGMEIALMIERGMCCPLGKF